MYTTNIIFIGDFAFLWMMNDDHVNKRYFLIVYAITYYILNIYCYLKALTLYIIIYLIN